jgi:hypothetical protein
LIVLSVYAQSPGAGRIIDGSVLISFNPFPTFIIEEQELNIYLDAVTGNLLFMAFKLLHGPFQAPGNAELTQVTGLAQMQETFSFEF